MTTTMNVSVDNIIPHDQRFDDAECINDVILQAARSQRGNVKRLAREADIPYQTLQSWFVQEDDGSYRRGPDDRLIRLMVADKNIRDGVMALVNKQVACQKR